jgi:hypothetical protein
MAVANRQAEGDVSSRVGLWRRTLTRKDTKRGTPDTGSLGSRTNGLARRDAAVIDPPKGIMGRLVEAWSAFRHLYVGTRSRGRMLWREADVRLLVTHMLLSSPGDEVYVDPDVTGFLGFGAVDLVVEAPETWTAEQNAPWALLHRPDPVALAFTVRVVDDARLLGELEADGGTLRTILQRRIAKEAALCVLDRTGGAQRRFYDDLSAAYGVTTLCVIDASAPQPFPRC